MDESRPDLITDLSARGELLLAARAAMRALPVLYATRNAGAGEDAEVYAAELFCLLGLYDAIGPGSGRGASPQQGATGVWDASYESVHHMSDLQDSTSKNHDATAVGNATFGSGGMIGNAALLDG